MTGETVGARYVQLAVLGLLLASMFACKKPTGELTAKQWGELIDGSIQVGSTREAVEKFLDQHGVPHTFIEKSNFPEERNSIVAYIKSRDEGLVRKAGVQLKFKFDENQKLIRYESRDVFTGP